jgi:hypothetical protein
VEAGRILAEVSLMTRVGEGMMVISNGNQVDAMKNKGRFGLLVALVGLLLLGFIAPIARADDSSDVARNLINQKAYVTDAVKANTTFMAKNANIDQQLKDTVNKVKSKADTRIAVINNAIIPPQGGTTTESYGNFLYGLLNKPAILIVVNADKQNVALISDQLSDSERQALIKDATPTFVTNVTNGTVQLAEKAADKIASNARAAADKAASDKTAGTLTTVAVVVVVVLLIVGSVTFLLINTKKSWKQRVAGVEELANQVSTQVVKVSDDVNFLPDPALRAQMDTEFGAATRNFSEANTRLGELRSVSPVTLLLKGAEYNRKLNLTGAQFDEARRSLSRVEQQLQRSLPS